MSFIYVIRHGKTDQNAKGIYCGASDVPLNSKGIDQSIEVGKIFKNYSIDLILCSTLIRARQTAKLINESIHKDIVYLKELIERSIGIFEGKTREEIILQYPDLYNQNLTRQFDKAPPEGETINEVIERVNRVFDLIKEKYNNKNILIVTHAFVSKVIHKFFNNTNDKEFFIYSLKNCEVAEYRISKIAQLFNE